jgi:hypothetical protein
MSPAFKISSALPAIEKASSMHGMYLRTDTKSTRACPSVH